MKQTILLVLAFFFCLHADAHKKRKKSSKKRKAGTSIVAASVKETDKNNAMRLCLSMAPQPDWFLEVPTNFKFPANFQQPANYRVLSTIDSSFMSFLKTIPFTKSKCKITLPLYMENTIVCKEFNISRAITMDQALQDKFPALMSFKAFAADNSLNTARIDCDESSVKMMITYNNKVYYINSMLQNKSKYYLSYAKDDPNFVKDKFER